MGYTTITGGQTLTLNLNDDIDNYSYLIAQGYTGGTMLGEMYVPIASLRGGSAYRVGYTDTSSPYWWDVTYVSNTSVKVKATYSSTATLAFRILGIKEYADI